MNSLAISSFMKKTRLWVKEMIHRSMVLAGEKSAVWTNDIPSSCVWFKTRTQELNRTCFSGEKFSRKNCIFVAFFVLWLIFFFLFLEMVRHCQKLGKGIFFTWKDLAK